MLPQRKVVSLIIYSFLLSFIYPSFHPINHLRFLNAYNPIYTTSQQRNSSLLTSEKARIFMQKSCKRVNKHSRQSKTFQRIQPSFTNGTGILHFSSIRTTPTSSNMVFSIHLVLKTIQKEEEEKQLLSLSAMSDSL